MSFDRRFELPLESDDELVIDCKKDECDNCNFVCPHNMNPVLRE